MSIIDVSKKNTTFEKYNKLFNKIAEDNIQIFSEIIDSVGMHKHDISFPCGVVWFPAGSLCVAVRAPIEINIK